VSDQIVAEFGDSIEERIKTELNAVQIDSYSEVADIKNLAGDSTGQINVYKAAKLTKACFLSIDVMPGARYINIHIHPEPRYRIPRFGFEGMISGRGSQVSMDVYPDMDLVMQAKEFQELCGELAPVWDEARSSELNIQPSRLPHMRGLASPFFLNSTNTTVEQLPQVESIGHKYLDHWLRIYHSAAEVDEAEAAERWKRREQFANVVIELDPDREMIVQVFGEETTQAIEHCLML